MATRLITVTVREVDGLASVETSTTTSSSSCSTADRDTDESSKSESKWLDEALERSCLRRTYSGNHLTWTEQHPARPKNWPLSQKILILVVIFSLEFFVTIIGTTGALGNIFIPPFTDAHGRRPWYIACTFVYAAACLITAAVPSLSGVIVGRSLAGFASSVPACVITGTISDLAGPNLRFWLIWFWNAISLVGQMLGPIMTAYLSESIGWRWVYYISAAVCVLIGLIVVPIPETRPTMLLDREVRRASETSGIGELKAYDPDSRTSAVQLVARASRLLVTEPIVAVVTGLVSYSFGLIYLYTAALGPVYQHAYGFTRTQSTLVFVSVMVGVALSPLPRILDYRAAARRSRLNQPLTPEDKLGGFAIAAPVLAGGLWLWAWAVPPAGAALHWAVGMLGLACVGFATTEISYANVNYLVDAYTVYSASSVAACEFVRATVGGIVPVFAGLVFDKLGPNVAGSLLAMLATLGCAAPVVLLRYGPRLRRNSPFANRSAVVNLAVG